MPMIIRVKQKQITQLMSEGKRLDEEIRLHTVKSGLRRASLKKLKVLHESC